MIDFTKSKQYTLSIRLSTDGFSFSIYNPINDNSQSLFEKEVDTSLSLTANLKNVFHESDFLSYSYKRVNIMIASKRFTMIPLELFEDEGNRDGVYVEVAMQHNDSFNDSTFSFVNNIITPEGGTHLAGFRNALTKTFNSYAREAKILKDSDAALTGDDIREGLTAIISIKIEEPQFEGQTKQKLGNSEARGAVDSVVTEQLTYFLEQNPDVAKNICEKSLLAQRAREAARKARDLTRRKTALEGTALPGKLADCSDKNPKNCEIFIVT